jgi:hypothetical protein
LLLLFLHALDLLGNGDVARPAAASPPPARLAWAMACALTARSVVLALTRITSSGVSWNMRLKRSGSTKRTVSRKAWAASEMIRAPCSVLRRQRRVSCTCCSSAWRVRMLVLM